MCIFQSGKNLPPLIRLSIRTLQYLVIPFLSLGILTVGIKHLGKCNTQPYVPIWHIVAGSSGLLTPILYILFDVFNPWLSRKTPWMAEYCDNLVVCIFPIYICFEVGWLIVGTVWIFNTPGLENSDLCDHTIYVFSYVVIINFWIHTATPLLFLLGLWLSRVYPDCFHCAYWNILKKAVDNWTCRIRMMICCSIAIPLGIAMIVVGTLSVNKCGQFTPTTGMMMTDVLSTIAEDAFTLDNNSEKKLFIPIWLLVAGCGLLLVVPFYYLYNRFSRENPGSSMAQRFTNGAIVVFLALGLVWAILGFLWVFGAHPDVECGAGSPIYSFAYSTLIILNLIMDVWICYKIYLILYWAFISDE